MKVQQLPTPALILDLDAMERNMDSMNALLAQGNAKLRPHYKSNKSTAIAHMQIARGAKGISCAKLSEAEDLVYAGIEDVLIANQITDHDKILRLASLAKCARLGVCVDDAENIDKLQIAACHAGSTIHCLVEYDIGMGRCGVYSKEEVLKLAKQISGCSNLVFEGIQAYAGNLAHEEDTAARMENSARIETDLRQLKAYLEDNGLPVKEISGVSTGTVAYHCKDTVYTEIQAGSYLFMDAAYAAVGAKFGHSLFVLASVISRANGAVITDAGMKAVSVDQRPPKFPGFESCPVNMSEEHSSFRAEGCSLKTGDKLRLIPSHCCTTVNLYDFLYLIRGDQVVDRVPVTGRGHSL